MAKLLYQGHGSFRITAEDGMVMYIDPFAGDGYDVPADLILVTHQHGDHNQLQLVTQKPGCRIISNTEALAGETHNFFTVGGIGIRAVEAANKNHDPRSCVGYVLTVDGLKIYAAGDTSKTKTMSELGRENIDYTLMPCDGIYNMDLKEASECARIIGARHNIPIHMKPGELFDRNRAEAWDGPNRLILSPGEEIDL